MLHLLVRIHQYLFPFHFAVKEADQAAAVAGNGFVVSDLNDGQPSFPVQTLEYVHDDLSGAGVQGTGRLIGQDNRRLANQSTGDGHALLLAARQLERVMVTPVGKPDGLERRLGPPTPFAAAHPAVNQGQFHVRLGIKVGKQVKALKDEPDELVAKLG